MTGVQTCVLPISAETVAKQTVQSAKAWLVGSAAVSDYLADQLLLPAALAALQGHASSFTAQACSPHFTTNVQTIQRFVAVEIKVAQESSGAWLVKVGI